jgi:hypothetical protein
MQKSIVSVLLSSAILLTVGATRSWGDTITFNNSSIHPDGELTVTMPEGTMSEPDLLGVLGIEAGGTCASDFGCVSGSPSGGGATESNSGTADFAPSGGFAQLPMGLTPASFDTVPDTSAAGAPATLGLSPNGSDDTGGPSLVVQFEGLSAPVGEPSVAGPSVSDTILAQDLAPAAVPESGSLILVGFGLVGGAKYLRRRRLA